MKIAIVQTKPHKGDVERNLGELGEAMQELASDVPDLIVLPETALTGYFLEGAVFECARTAQDLASRLAALWHAASPRGVDIVLGFYENDGGTLYNASMYVEIGERDHRIVHVHHKMFLPTYGVFDEERFVTRGRHIGVFPTRFGTASMLLCEDVWHTLVPTIAALQGARLIVVPSASPGRGFATDGVPENVERWRQILSLVAAEHGVYVLYAGLAGFEGGKGMSGGSCVVDPHGAVLAPVAPPIGAYVLRAEIDLGEIDRARAQLPLLGDLSGALADLYREFSRALGEPGGRA